MAKHRALARRRPRTVTGRPLTVAALLLTATRVEAGLLDSPPPMFGGVAGTVVYRMGPVHYRPGETDTVISCTNIAAGPVYIAVELFDDQDRTVASPGRATLPVGGTVNIVTSDAVGIGRRMVIENLPELDSGKARISADSARISCVGYHRLRGADGSVREMALELVKRVFAPSPTSD